MNWILSKIIKHIAIMLWGYTTCLRMKFAYKKTLLCNFVVTLFSRGNWQFWLEKNFDSNDMQACTTDNFDQNKSHYPALHCCYNCFILLHEMLQWNNSGIIECNCVCQRTSSWLYDYMVQSYKMFKREFIISA